MLGVLVTALVAVAGQASAGAADVAGRSLQPPTVPAELQVPAGNSVFLVGDASGTQQYVCLGNGSTVAWTFFAPQATLVTGRLPVSHFLSPNPDQGGAAQPTWQAAEDLSRVWGAAMASSSDPAFVAPGAIPWLLLRVTGAEPVGDHGGRLLAATYLQRVQTGGGTAPATGCSDVADIGKKALVPYTAKYYFYRAVH